MVKLSILIIILLACLFILIFLGLRANKKFLNEDTKDFTFLDILKPSVIFKIYSQNDGSAWFLLALLPLGALVSIIWELFKN